MKKLILTTLALFSFSTVSAEREDFLIGFAAGTVPVLGQIWLSLALRNMKADCGRSIKAALSSLVGTYAWYKTAELLKEKTELGNLSYLNPALPVPLAAGLVILKDRLTAPKTNRN